ncbi:MAG TPA: hypothetical protein VH063_16670 [Gaiellaceae bacterium]|nr:hypothetical protein [Gaiellaceae bacterium]
MPLIVGGVLVLVAVVAGVFLIKGGGGSSTPVATINCIGGSEKQELMADPDVIKILHDRYHLVVNFTPQGSYDQVQLTTAELKAKNVDCLWPSSASAQLVFEKTHAVNTDFPAYAAATVLQSPEVIYAGPDGTQALLSQGLVAQRDGHYYVEKLQQLLTDVLSHEAWSDLGAKTIAGPVNISSTDPAKSNSGFTLSQLELIIVSTDNAFQAPTVAQAQKGLPVVRKLYNSQGLQAQSSDFGFDQWLLQGGELHAPLYAGYESQVIGKMVSYQGDSDAEKQLLASVRILYPDPTIYADHPILALDATAGRFITAMKDPDIQKLAWERYGFRSGVSIGTDVSYFKELALPAQLQTTSPPNADVTLLLLRCIQKNICK